MFCCLSHTRWYVSTGLIITETLKKVGVITTVDRLGADICDLTKAGSQGDTGPRLAHIPQLLCPYPRPLVPPRLGDWTEGTRASSSGLR